MASWQILKIILVLSDPMDRRKRFLVAWGDGRCIHIMLPCLGWSWRPSFYALHQVHNKHWNVKAYSEYIIFPVQQTVCICSSKTLDHGQWPCSASKKNVATAPTHRPTTISFFLPWCGPLTSSIFHMDLFVSVDPLANQKEFSIQWLVTCCMLLPHSSMYSTIDLVMFTGVRLMWGGSLATRTLCMARLLTERHQY